MIETEEFSEWLAGLKIWQRAFPVSEGVVEMREFFGPGWRMYYVERAKKLAKEW